MLQRVLCFIMGFMMLGISVSSNIYADDITLYGEQNTIINDLLDRGFETERLVAVRETKEDVPFLSEYLMNKDVTKYLDPMLSDGFDSKEDAEKFLIDDFGKDNVYLFTIKLKDSLLPVGQVSYDYHPETQMLEIGYFIAADYQGFGYASEIVLPLTSGIFKSSIDIESVYISCDYRNVSSYKLANKMCEFITKDTDEYICSKGGPFETGGNFNGKEIKFTYYEFSLMKGAKL